MMRRRLTRSLPVPLVAVLLAALGGRGSSLVRADDPLQVRASAAFAAAVRPALDAFSRETGMPVVLDVREPDPAAGADLVVGDDSELTRALEGGSVDLATSFDLGYLPWVFVVPQGSPADVSAALAGADRIVVLGGRLGREARAAVGRRLPAAPTSVASDPAELRAARHALVPRSLAGPGEQRPAGIRPLVAVAAVVSDAAHPAVARQLLAFLKSARGRTLLAAFLSQTSGAAAQAAGTNAYAAAVVDWWLPACSLEHNGYNDPTQVLGAPDAVSLGAKDKYLGFMSLGEGGYVTVDMGVSAIDGAGPDVRVFQTVSGEPVTLYAAAAAQGPFTLVGLRVPCGARMSGVYSRYCDFDLHDAGLAQARYFKVEDGELYPCLEGGTITEGADIDAVQVLNQAP